MDLAKTLNALHGAAAAYRNEAAPAARHGRLVDALERIADALEELTRAEALVLEGADDESG